MPDLHPQSDWVVNNFAITFPADRTADLLRTTADTVQNDLRLDYVLNWIFLFNPERSAITSTVYFDWARCGSRDASVAPDEADPDEIQDALASLVMDADARADERRSGAAWAIQTEISITIFDSDSVAAVLRAADVIDQVSRVPVRISFLTDPASIAELDGPLALSIAW